MGDDELCRQLMTVLQRETGVPSLAFEGEPVRLRGGFWADLFAFRLRGAPDGWDGDLVARVMPDAGLACKETLIQADVAALGYPTPVVRASGGPDDGLGRAFMVMDHAPGAPLLVGLDGVPVTRLPRLAASIPETLALTMARLHALNAEPLRVRLTDACEAGTSVEEMLVGLEAWAGHCRRTDLSSAARWLLDRPPASLPLVICHGDLHPFNVLVDGDGHVTVLDWSAALIAPRPYDVAFTSLVVAEPPLLVGAILRSVVRAGGRLLSWRFVRRYQHHSGTTIDKRELRWYQAVVCLRALVEVAGWVDEQTVGERDGHPWLVSGPAFARRLSKVTGVPVRAR